MICLHCGYCCIHLSVVIVDNPKLGIQEGNLIHHAGNGPCKHLIGNHSGKYMCAVHNEEWYKETPCFQYTQIESSIDSICRIGLLKMKGIDDV
jgi:hypothetical protein